MNTEEAQAALRKPLSSNDWRYHRLYAGTRDSRLIDTLFVEGGCIRKEIYEQISVDARVNCDNHKEGETGYMCRRIDFIKQRCGFDVWVDWTKDVQKIVRTVKKDNIYISKSYEIAVIRNHLVDECSFLRFQAYYYTIGLAGFGLAPVEVKPKKKEEPKNYSLVINNVAQKPDDAAKIVLYVSFTNVELAQMVLKYTDEEKQEGTIGFQLLMRSPESMVRYLGDIISLELFRGKKFRPTVFIGNNTEA